MSALAVEKCEVCRAGASKVTDEELAELMSKLSDWSVKKRNDISILEKTFKLKNYKKSVTFTNKVADMAEEEKHHPEILLEWGKVTVTWWTHTINGLHKNDFICAAKTDVLFEE
jgi:4a-hydroxytetrahydrobiopterin dehydratase